MVYKKSKMVYGVGINDADYTVNRSVNGSRVICRFYSTWNSMLGRCYSAVSQTKNPSYAGCCVVDEWHRFSNFKAWMESQDWKEKEIDKDLLFVGNKVYSPDTCVFVDKTTNIFTTDSRSVRGKWPIGVSLKKCTGRFYAQCGNPFTGKSEYIGYFNCPNQAHDAWRKRKHEIACQLADLQIDERVAQALRTRYL